MSESTIKTLPADAKPQDIQQALIQDGALVVEGVLRTDEVAQASGELQPYLDDTHEGRNEFAGFNTKRIGALLARSESARKLALHPLVNEACDRILSPFADGYQLHFTQGVSIGPGETAQANR